jgi:hypothetical protein
MAAHAVHMPVLGGKKKLNNEDDAVIVHALRCISAYRL